MSAGGLKGQIGQSLPYQCISLEEAENNSFTWESWIFLLLRLHHRRMIEMITRGTSFIWQSWGTCSWLWCHLQRCEGLNLSTGQCRVLVSQRETSVRHILMLTPHLNVHVCYSQIHMWMLSFILLFITHYIPVSFISMSHVWLCYIVLS